MSKDELWIQVRAVLVEHGFMLKSGIAVEGYENLCLDFRRLILKEIK